MNNLYFDQNLYIKFLNNKKKHWIIGWGSWKNFGINGGVRHNVGRGAGVDIKINRAGGGGSPFKSRGSNFHCWSIYSNAKKYVAERVGGHEFWYD